MSGEKRDSFRLAGVMGHPVLHSRSPLIHNHWMREHGLAGVYVPLAIAPGNLESALRALPPLGFSGVNLTIPHKVAALSIVDRADEAARRIGAVNTIVVAPDGSLEGRNTDAFGFIESLRERDPAFDAGKGPALVIGAGGAARAILHGLLEAGAPSIRIVNRTRARAQILAADFGPRIETVSWDKRAEAVSGANLVVQTTSLGMQGEEPLVFPLDELPCDAVVADIVYVPKRTPLLAAAASRGNMIVEGLGMLLHQARPAFDAWFGVRPVVTPELRAILERSLSNAPK